EKEATMQAFKMLDEIKDLENLLSAIEGTCDVGIDFLTRQGSTIRGSYPMQLLQAINECAGNALCKLDELARGVILDMEKTA
ncbi:MAG: hypothetical protein RR739_09295, partial [Clostridia bacterium]